MVLKKQTVWLLSMLTVLVVLSAYYLVQGPNSQLTSKGKQSALPADIKLDAAVKTKEDTNKPPVMTASDDYFVSSRMKRNDEQGQEMDKYLEVMQSGTAQPTAVEQAKKKYDELASLQDTETQVEELIKSAGNFKNAIVIAKDDMVRVIVQAQSLKPEKAVEIISLVKQHMKVSGNNIIVSYK
ncbi:SpoIIIAH-like family protein [Aneurinibacillus sp. Ricciae_BoGa-3]|uniref:SpoIIIAH-like family protein n=1 Tax=Aneurinibacillus sp. Ricciae_BoGa-3 TaxID=3022697 RepID=UPI002340BDC3|nr:SpoIIIAH-like family protein [Aneurinibacillus sp. Ricciae_BoGa-3]WCK53148.1 SpoIIIAH-like family protein [Aneurinibacillus sp. Ricciae_BoGa-3]